MKIPRNFLFLIYIIHYFINVFNGQNAQINEIKFYIWYYVVLADSLNNVVLMVGLNNVVLAMGLNNVVLTVGLNNVVLTMGLITLCRTD